MILNILGWLVLLGVPTLFVLIGVFGKDVE
jgi:hypothetical protein